MSEDRLTVNFEAISIEEGVGYASDYDINALYKVNIETGSCTYIGRFPEEQINQKRIHACAMRIRNKVYFAPASGNHLHIYDIDTNSFCSIGIPTQNKKEYSFYKPKYKFVGIARYEDYLWIIPSSYPGLLRLNMSTNAVDIFNDWIPKGGYFFRTKPYIEDNIFIVANGDNNLAMTFNMTTKKATITRVGMNNKGVFSLCKSGNIIWMVPRLFGPIVGWNTFNNSVIEIDDYPQNISAVKLCFSNIYEFDGKLYCSPAKGNMGLILNNGAITQDTEHCWREEKGSVVEFLFETEKMMFYREILSNKKNRYYKVNKLDNTLVSFGFNIENEKEYKTAFILDSVKNGEILEESANCSLSDFVNILLGS